MLDPVTSTAATPTVVRATDLRTKRQVASVYFAQGSPRVITLAVLVALVVRLLVGSWGWADLVISGVTVVLVGVVEWVIHLFLLHAPEDAWTSRRLGTGSGHRLHHLDPPDIEWLLLRGVDAGVFVVLIAAWTAAWSIPTAFLLGRLVDGVGLLGPFLTGVFLAYLSLAHYEWTHLLVHTRYRPRTRYYRRLARNHRRHHYRNERYWLGVTSNLGDRLLRTYPADAADVPLSDTARTLGV